MVQRKIVSIIICSILLYSCNKKASNNSIEDIKILKNELQETKITEVITEENDSVESTSAEANSVQLDTTNYFSTCLYENIENGASSFKTIENKLIEAKILKSNSPSAYRDFFLNYLFNSQLGSHDYITVNTGKVDKQFYENKLRIATIFKESIKTKNDFQTKSKECLENAATLEGFKHSNYTILNNTSRQLMEQIYSWELQEKHPNLSLFEALQKELPSSLFTNLDTRLGSYLYLLTTLSEYTKEKMELEYIQALEIIKNAKQEEVTKEKVKVDSVKNKYPEIEEIEVLSEEETQELIKNGNIIIESNEIENNN